MEARTYGNSKHWNTWLILIVVLALIIFGPKKLPEIGKAAGQTLREFKSSANSLMEDNDDEDKEKENTEEVKV